MADAANAERSVREPRYIPPVAPPPEHEPTERMVYVNWVRAIGGPYDLTLDLGYRTDPEPPDSFPVRATMSWEQAKVLKLLLDDAIESFESEVGPIREIDGEIAEAREPDDPSGEPANGGS